MLVILFHCRVRTRGGSSPCLRGTGHSEATACGLSRNYRSGAFVGRVGLHYPEGWPDREIGWAIARSYWGRGYALEAATAALRVAIEVLDWPRVVSLIAAPNLRSIRLAERLGERFERVLILRGHEVMLYSMDRLR